MDDIFTEAIDISQVLTDNNLYSELLAFQDLQQRKLFLLGEINQYSIPEIIKNILQYNKEDEGIAPEDRKPIRLFIMSTGGEEFSGYGLIDAIEYSITPVYTINIGYALSMAFMIGLAGHKRYSTKNAIFLMHDGINVYANSGAKCRDAMEFQAVTDERDKQYVVSHSKITADEYDKMFRNEVYMLADKAKERGCVDLIIGVDCDIREIL